MSTIGLFLTGDEIGTFDSVSGKSNGTKVTLNGVEPFGSATDTYRVYQWAVDRDLPLSRHRPGADRGAGNLPRARA